MPGLVACGAAGGGLPAADAGRARGTGWVRAVVSLPGGLLASGSNDNTVRLWEVESGRLVRTLAGHTGYVNALAGLPGGLLASGSADRNVAVWRVADAVGQ